MEIINIRLTAHGRLRKPSAPDHPEGDASPPAPADERMVWFDPEAPVLTPVFDRSDLRPGHAVAGPAVIEQLDATSLVFPGDHARVDRHLNLRIELQG